MAARYHSTPTDKARELFTILHLLATRRPGRRIGREELARACECSIKTIQRSISTLRTANIPIDYDESERTYYIPEKGWNTSLVTLTTADAMALALARALLADVVSFPLTAEIHTAIDKATVGLSPQLRMLMEVAANGIVDRGGLARDYSQAPLAALMKAQARQVTVEMLYSSRNSGICTRRLVDPYRLDRRDGQFLELQAWCHNNRTVRTFALNRVLEARLTGKRFEIRPWDQSHEGIVSGLRGGAFVEVEVEFDSVVAPFAKEKQWPFQADFEEATDGSVVMRGRVQGLDGIVCELLRWRSHARVVGGPELRARMESEVKSLAALYS